MSSLEPDNSLEPKNSLEPDNLKKGAVMFVIAPIITIALLCGSVLTYINHLSKPRITAQQQAFETAQLQQVLGNAPYQITPTSELQAHYLLKQNDKVVGELRQLTTNEGYNGTIRFWLATRYPSTKKQGAPANIIGVRITHHKETPGLGDKLDISVSDWVLGFNGESLESANWDVKKYGGDFDQFSGATITPRAVVLRIKEHLLDVDQQTLKPQGQEPMSSGKSK